jgi:hypothetical protein
MIVYTGVIDIVVMACPEDSGVLRITRIPISLG